MEDFGFPKNYAVKISQAKGGNVLFQQPIVC